MDQITLIRRIKYFIKRRATGTPNEFAQKLGISKSGLHYTLKKLKEDFEAPIEYNRKDAYNHYSKDEEGIYNGFILFGNPPALPMNN